MGVSAGGGPAPSDRYKVRGVDPDEVRSMFVPHWVAQKVMRGVQPLDALHRMEEKLYMLIRARGLCGVMPPNTTGATLSRRSAPRWVQFVVCNALVESRATDMTGRYADVERVLDVLRDDEGLRDAARAVCMLGGAPAVRQFVAETFFGEAQA